MHDQMAIREASLNGRIAEQSRKLVSLRRALENSVIIDVDLLCSYEQRAIQMRITIEKMSKKQLHYSYMIDPHTEFDRSRVENDKLAKAISERVAYALTEAAANNWRRIPTEIVDFLENAA